jgi:hypothetical protein
MRKKLFPGDHEDVADSYNNLSTVYKEIKVYKSANEYQTLALEMRNRLDFS